MHAKQQIHIGILMCAASLISSIEGAPLSMLLPSSQRFAAIGPQSHLIDPISTNLRQSSFSKRNGGVQPKLDQDVLDLENLKHNNGEQDEKIASIEEQLENKQNGHHSQDQMLSTDIVDNEPTDSDVIVQAANNDNNINDNFNINGNANGDRLQGPPPKQYHGAARLAFGQNPEINAEYLFKHSGGQYSALDMAQYVFWTGDEEGVAKAVEEFIRKGLMSRESAIKFLRDISMGIDYLENAYSTNRQFDQLDDNTLRNEDEYQAKKLIDRTLNGHTDKIHQSNFVYDSNDLIEPVSIPSTTTTTAKPIIVVEKSVNLPFADLSLPLMQLNEIANERNTKEHPIHFDEQSGRLRLADFLYAEYSLEEVIYQLAKVMFAQSLTKGSEETQVALQRLTTFLEAEGASGRISPALQKKVLDVLFVALSDCLAENPQLFPAARLSLGEVTNPLPKLSDKH